MLLYIYSIFHLAVFIALVYGYIQFIRIAKRAIRVLDIYLKEHSGPEETE